MFLFINVQQLLEIACIISHNLCYEDSTKFVWLPLHSHKPPLQDDTKTYIDPELASARIFATTSGNWKFMQY